MFDLGTTKLLVLGIIALLVVGPKDLPAMLRTIGRYVGMIKRQAAEFRTQFDDAMKESEFADLKKQVEDFGRDAHGAVRDAETTLNQGVSSVHDEANKSLATIEAEAAKMAQAHPAALPPNQTATPDQAAGHLDPFPTPADPGQVASAEPAVSPTPIPVSNSAPTPAPVSAPTPAAPKVPEKSASERAGA